MEAVCVLVVSAGIPGGFQIDVSVTFIAAWLRKLLLWGFVGLFKWFKLAFFHLMYNLGNANAKTSKIKVN